MGRKKRIGAVRITYLPPSRGIFPIYRQWFVESPSYLGKEYPIFRDKYVFPYQRLPFYYLGLSLRGVRDSETGKFADNTAIAGFSLLGAYL